ncbi:cytochrome P450 [Marasmius fiardii PR-910]|nr:cytochrome P450 [Marasmius fiardii PR-910]
MGNTSAINALLLLAFLYVSARSLGRSKLDLFPGPFLARWTTLYRMYYDLVKGGDWVEHVQKLHTVYGPIVRVGPNELHFSNPEVYNEIYATGSKFTKDEVTYKPVVDGGHVFAILDPHEAMIRRGMVLPYFSRRSMLARERILKQKTDEFVDMLLNNHGTDQSPLNLHEALRSFIGGLVPAFCFPDVEQHAVLASSGLLSKVTETPTGKFPWMFIKTLPVVVRQGLQRLADTGKVKIGSNEYSRVKELEAYGILADDAINSQLSEIEEQNENLCHSLLKRSMNNRPNPTREWLLSETLNVKYAGIDTTPNATFVTIRGVLGNGAILKQLVSELTDAWPELDDMAPGVLVLEKLPYLTAVIKEGIRLSIGIVSPLSRIVGPEDAMISGVSVPAGTIVGIANSMLHLNQDIFPDPHVFKPERWLQGDSQKLEKYFVAFGRGPRSCVGIHLAWSILYLSVANILRRLNLHPTAMNDLLSPLRIKDEFVSVYDGEPIYVHVEAKQN